MAAQILYIVAASCTIAAFLWRAIGDSTPSESTRIRNKLIHRGYLLRIARSASSQVIATSGRVPLEIATPDSPNPLLALHFHLRCILAALFLRPSSRKPAFVVDSIDIQSGSGTDKSIDGLQLGGFRIIARLHMSENLDHFYRSIKPSPLGRLSLRRKQEIAIVDSGASFNLGHRVVVYQVDIRRRCLTTEGDSIVTLVSARTPDGPKPQPKFIDPDEMSPNVLSLVVPKTGKNHPPIETHGPMLIKQAIAIRLWVWFWTSLTTLILSVLFVAAMAALSIVQPRRVIKCVWRGIRYLLDLSPVILRNSLQVAKGTYIIFFGSRTRLEANCDIPGAERNDDIELYVLRRAITVYLLANTLICLVLLAVTEDSGIFEVSVSNGYFSLAWMFWAACLLIYVIVHLGRKLLYERKSEGWSGGTTRCIRDGDLLRDGR